MCMKSEVLNEIATLNYPMSLDKITFSMLCKYNKAKNNAEDTSKLGFAKSREKNLEKISNLSKVAFNEVEI